jgi:nucleoside-diphosphate-sugar epimerase
VAKILITGAGGFLGTWLTKEFISSGHAVRASDLPGADLSQHQNLGAEPVECDVTELQTMERAAEGMDIVVHAAGIFDLSASSELLWAVNRDGARAMAEVAAKKGATRFVMVSSTSVYGRNIHDVDEDAPKNPSHDYDRSKCAGEEAAILACANHGLPITVIRPTLIYGPGGRYGIANALALMALRSQHGLSRLPIARGGPCGHHVHVEDVARAVVSLATDERAKGGIYNLADDAPLPAGELVRILAEATGVRITTPALPWWLTRCFGLFKPILRRIFVKENSRLRHMWQKLADKKELVVALQPRIDVDWVDFMFIHHSYNNGRLKALGFEYRHPDVRVGLRETVSWYKENRWLPTSDVGELG